MLSLVKALFALALLGVPLVVITTLPRLFELAGSVPSRPADTGVLAPSPAFRLVETPTTGSRSRFAPLNETPPPTLAPPEATATPVATPRPAPTGERIVIGNTGGRGTRRSPVGAGDRKSTRLNSSHANISYAVFCLKKKTLSPA